MSDFEQYRSILSGDVADDFVLDSVYEIENWLSILKQLSVKLDFYKDLKKFRADSISKIQQELKEKESYIRRILLQTMQQLEPKEKTLHFPDVGKVTRRQAKDSVSIVDEDKLIKFLKSEGLYDDVIEIKHTLNAVKAKKAIKDFLDNGKAVPGVLVIKGGQSLSIAYEKQDKKQVDKLPDKSGKPSLDDLDALLPQNIQDFEPAIDL